MPIVVGACDLVQLEIASDALLDCLTDGELVDSIPKLRSVHVLVAPHRYDDWSSGSLKLLLERCRLIDDLHLEVCQASRRMTALPLGGLAVAAGRLQTVTLEGLRMLSAEDCREVAAVCAAGAAVALRDCAFAAGVAPSAVRGSLPPQQRGLFDRVFAAVSVSGFKHHF
jgi:hypothetical protein